jgi:hypothetical protein
LPKQGSRANPGRDVVLADRDEKFTIGIRAWRVDSCIWVKPNARPSRNSNRFSAIAFQPAVKGTPVEGAHGLQRTPYDMGCKSTAVSVESTMFENTHREKS